MKSLSVQEWSRALQDQDEKALAQQASALGFAEERKSVANLILLHDLLNNPNLLLAIARTALTTADPDQALNNLERLANTVPATDLTPILTDDATCRSLLTVLGASPFLTGILCRKRDYFIDLFPGRDFFLSKQETDMLADLQSSIPATATFAELQKELRLYKSREVLRIGSRDLCGLASLEEVTGELTALAAASLQRAVDVCSQLLNDEYGEPVLEDTEENEGRSPEFTIFGMGKFGGCELNFSSDIDLIYFYTSDHGQTAGVPDASGRIRKQIPLHKYYVRLAEMVTKALGQVTEDGFVFRVDLRLRPEGNSGEMALSLVAAEIYYESWGQSWERSAMLKARPVAGSQALGERLLQRLEPFIYRRHLDYAMI